MKAPEFPDVKWLFTTLDLKNQCHWMWDLMRISNLKNGGKAGKGGEQGRNGKERGNEKEKTGKKWDAKKVVERNGKEKKDKARKRRKRE